MDMTIRQKAAAWALVPALLAGCDADTGRHSFTSPDSGQSSSSSSTTSSATPPTITGPVSTETITGSTATFSVTATGTGLTYQWTKNGTAIPGATTASYTTAAVAYGDDGTRYQVVVQNGNGAKATSAAAVLHLALSADQAANESMELAANGGIYENIWELNYVGSQVSGTDYLAAEGATLATSPLTAGPQLVTESALANMTAGLPLPTVATTRFLKNGTVLVVPGTQYSAMVSYVGSAIQVDYLASDNATVAYSEIRSGYQVGTLQGLLHSAPSQLTNPYNSVFANPGVLDTITDWAAGSAYMVFTARSNGDRYEAVDCTIDTTTTGNTPAPCQTGTTLTAAMTAGEPSTSDATTYTLAQGTISTVGGVNIWVANAPRPTSAVDSSTVEYRIYYELNGNIYTGHKINDTQVIGSFRYRTDPTDVSTTVYLPYQVRLNQAATNSLRAGSLL